ncbi:hypothetical protein HWV62_20544 [Athelia sp. TMB]|nr:hypothetical protein HWV62_20544 [Athelia sp. TMB]
MPEQPGWNKLPPKYTIEQLLVDLDLLDVTGHVRKDPGQPHSLGSGAAGEVHRGLYEWTEPGTMQVVQMKVAMKYILSAPHDRIKTEEVDFAMCHNCNIQLMQNTQRIRREVATWRYLNHPNVTEFIGIAQIEPNRPPALVSRFMHRNKFLDYIGRHPELKREKAIEIALGLEYLHTRNPPVIHSDIKPARFPQFRRDNILISDSGAAQLNDFGASRILDVQGFTTKVMRNMRYTAPELLPMAEIQEDPQPTTQSDIFSLAMLLLVLFNHRHNIELQSSIPYNHVRLVNDNGSNETKLLRRIHAGERPIRERYPTINDGGIWETIQICWQPFPSQRPRISQVVPLLLSLSDSIMTS